MSRLYPSLDEKFKSENLCPICFMEMTYNSPRFSCDSDHIICQRCRPYYFNCPQCLQPLSEVPPHLHQQPPPTGDFMPHLPYLDHPYPPPSAPNLEEFHEHERNLHCIPQSMPSEQSELFECCYSNVGCTAKFVAAQRDIHNSRCPYKYRNEEHLNQVVGCEDPEKIPCKYQSAGCNVFMPHWRLPNHEEMCVYKNREPSPPCVEENRVPCKYETVGCNVRMPHWRLHHHEEICIYKNREPSPTNCVEDDRIPCKYESVGCNVRVPHWRLHDHEGICIYKDREHSSCESTEERLSCRYHSVGCNVRTSRWRLQSHEEICIYKDRANHDSGVVEELSQHLQGSCHLQEDPYQMVGCRFQAQGCSSRMPLWRRQTHESQCIYRSY